MKNKPVTYLLATLVVLIWGYVIRLIWVGLDNEQDPLPKVVRKPDLSEDLNFYRHQDTLSLTLSYRDPMIYGKKPKSTEQDPLDDMEIYPYETQEYMDPMAYQEAVMPIDLQYLGFIENEAKQNRVAIVLSQGRQMMVSKGDIVDDLTILDIQSDRIQVKRGNERELIYKH